MTTQPEILVQDIDHLGIIAGIIDEMGLVEEIDRQLGTPQQQQVSAGQVVKAMILNGLGFVSAEQVQVMVADSALYSEDNLQSLGELPWICRVPATLRQAKQLLQAGRPRQDAQARRISYHLQATLVPKQTVIQAEVTCAGCFILATNITDPQQLSNDEVLQEYKAQQSSERGFRFLKEPLFFTSSVFVKSPKRVAALAMVMGLCLLVYSLGQRQLRQALLAAQQSLKNQLGKATQTPTLRWVFQCFQAVHLLQIAGSKQVSNLSDERKWILRFLEPTCRQYYSNF